MEEVVKKQAAGLDVLGVDGKDIGSYLETYRLHRLLTMLQDGVTAEGVNREERLAVKGALMLQLLLTKAKRAGDVANLSIHEVLERENEEDGEEHMVGFNIVTYMEASSGKTCSLLLSTTTLKLLRRYISLFSVRHQHMVTLKGDPLSSSVSAFNSSRGYNIHDQLSLIILRFFQTWKWKTCTDTKRTDNDTRISGNEYTIPATDHCT